MKLATAKDADATRPEAAAGLRGDEMISISSAIAVEVEDKLSSPIPGPPEVSGPGTAALPRENRRACRRTGSIRKAGTSESRTRFGI